MQRLTLSLLVVASLSACVDQPTSEPPLASAPSPAAVAAVAPAAPGPPVALPEPTVAAGIDEPVTVINTMPLPVDVTVVSTPAEGESTEVRFGPIAPEGRATQVVRVQTGGTFVVQAHWTYEDQPRQSNAFTANLLEGSPITPVTLTLGMTFARPTVAQWKMVAWDEP